MGSMRSKREWGNTWKGKGKGRRGKGGRGRRRGEESRGEDGMDVWEDGRMGGWERDAMRFL